MPLYPRPICQEEEGEIPGGGAGGWSPGPHRVPFHQEKSAEHEGKEQLDENGEPEESPEIAPKHFWSEDAFSRVMEERKSILANDKLSVRQKRQLLDTNRYPLAVVTNRGIPFRTEEVVRWMLIYSMAVVIILALLTAFAHLEKEVTISFVGTVIGGMIATVAQKLGKIGQ